MRRPVCLSRPLCRSWYTQQHMSLVPKSTQPRGPSLSTGMGFRKSSWQQRLLGVIPCSSHELSGPSQRPCGDNYREKKTGLQGSTNLSAIEEIHGLFLLRGGFSHIAAVGVGLGIPARGLSETFMKARKAEQWPISHLISAGFLKLGIRYACQRPTW